MSTRRSRRKLLVTGGNAFPTIARMRGTVLYMRARFIGIVEAMDGHALPPVTATGKPVHSDVQRVSDREDQ